MPDNASHPRVDTASRVIDALPAEIYAAFSDAASLMKWLPPSGMTGRAIEYDFRLGGSYRIELRYAGEQATASGKTTDQTDISKGHFLELRPEHRIKQSVQFDSNDPAFAGEMTMTWSFEPTAEGTRVTIRADHVPRGISKADHDAGLRSSLDQLAAFVGDSRKRID